MVPDCTCVCSGRNANSLKWRNNGIFIPITMPDSSHPRLRLVLSAQYIVIRRLAAVRYLLLDHFLILLHKVTQWPRLLYGIGGY